MSIADPSPGRKWRVFSITVAVGLVGTAIVSFILWNREDHRVTYDKEGRYLPGFSLRELALAMHAYQDKHGRLPPAAIYDEDGKPLLSWRVLLLPHLENDELFRQFSLDEPWDSPHNVVLLPKMPTVYSPLNGNPPLEPHTTLFQVFVGNGTAFEGTQGLRLKEDFPRRSYTILIVEAGKSVPWTKPEDLPYDENQLPPKLGGFFRGRFHVVMVDGTSASISRGVRQSTLRDAILRRGDGPLLWDDR
jgi:Protein of unknown function (DUF1559)